MLERFLESFRPDEAGLIDAVFRHPRLLGVSPYLEMARVLGSGGYGEGRIFLLDDVSGHEAESLIATAFPQKSGLAIPFARDWLGRIYAVDRMRLVEGDPQINLFELGVARVLDVDHSLESFFDFGLVDEPDLYLEQDVYDAWVANGGAIPGRDECASFIKPPFLGGDYSENNLEITDLSVHWSVIGQLIEAVRALPPGTSIGGLSIN